MPEAGLWGLPGGKVDPGEAVATAAEREIAEELGLTIRADVLLCVARQSSPSICFVEGGSGARIELTGP